MVHKCHGSGGSAQCSPADAGTLVPLVAPRFISTDPRSDATPTRALMIRPRSVAFALAVLLLPVAARRAFAWDDLGHMVITRLAWTQLTPAARARVVALLEQAPADAGLAQLRPAAGAPDRDLMFAAYASTWPDLARRQDPAGRHAYHRPPWHYINWFWTTSPEGTVEPIAALQPDSINIVMELARQSKIVGDSAASPADRAVALAWLLHLGGDIAQPLHTSSRVSAEDPAGDKGGNSFFLEKGMSLHWYWDRVLTVQYPRGQGEEDAAYVARVAAQVLAHAPKASATAKIADGEFELWARQSLYAAENQVYCCGLERARAAPPAYLAHADEVSEPAIALAALRLAALLDRLLGT